MMAAAPSVVLALDTATPFLTLALVWPGGARQVSHEVGRAHAERLATATRALFTDAGLPFHADALVIGTGPGSYTGVRVGASYALGLGRVWNAPVRGVPTLEALVRGAGRQAVALDARKGNVYAALYDVQGGVVRSVVRPPQKRALDDLRAEAGDWPLHLDVAPDGLALLRAGLDHGATDWALHYL